MKKSSFLFWGLVLISITACSSNEKHGFKSVAVQEFANIIADTTTVILVDVRTAEEYGSGHIENALNIDVKQDDFEKNAINMLPKDKTIAVYCRSGRRSKKAAEILSQNGYNVIELDSGYTGWTNK
jgi:rhodanese-related sulfurtransferase